uniref:Uncharacterized protein n=1 Tax=Rhizophora mucronata TaxID=61149 RepID=A0A2P2LTN5_RHIMU
MILHGLALDLIKILCAIDGIIIQCNDNMQETGAGEEKDNLWRSAQEEVWNARRLRMGR